MWTKEKYDDFIKELISKGDPKVRAFTKKLSPTEDINKIIGIRVPELRLIGKKLAKEDPEGFINAYEGNYFEEKMLNGFVIGYSNESELYDKYLFNFSKLITDWSVSDSVSSTLTLIKKDNKHYYPLIKKSLKTNKEYQVRFALVMLMDHYMNDDYIDEILSICISLKSDKYYINMALAWLLCECYIKYPLKTDKYLNKEYLEKFVLNKTISKICDSFRITKETKEELKKRRT